MTPRYPAASCSAVPGDRGAVQERSREDIAYQSAFGVDGYNIVPFDAVSPCR